MKMFRIWQQLLKSTHWVITRRDRINAGQSSEDERGAVDRTWVQIASVNASIIHICFTAVHHSMSEVVDRLLTLSQQCGGGQDRGKPGCILCVHGHMVQKTPVR